MHAAGVDALTHLTAHYLGYAMAALIGGYVGFLFAGRSRRRRWKRFGRPKSKLLRRPLLKQDRSVAQLVCPTPQFDAAEQLRVVERAEFQRRRLLNRGEERLLRVLEQACAAEAPDWRVMAQVSLGEILSSPDESAYRAINSKRVDLLLVGSDGHAQHAIELQGSGHHLGPAATRDAIKREALRRAGIGYIEVLPGDTPNEVRQLVAKLAKS